MTRIWTGTADVVSGYTTVVLTGDPLTAANCPVDATIVLAGATYFVADADYPTMTVELTRAYEAGDGTVSAEIDPMTPLTGSVVALAKSIADYDAQLALLEARGLGMFYSTIGQTGAEDPEPGNIARDAAAWSDVTALYLDVLDATEARIDQSARIDHLAAGDSLIVESLASGAYAAFALSGAVATATGWRTLPVTYVGGAGMLADEEFVRVVGLKRGPAGAEGANGTDGVDGADALLPPLREVLTANRTYYVRLDGSDSNDGLANTSGGAFLTIQKAVDVAAALDFGVYDVAIQVADGTYAPGSGVPVADVRPWTGSGSLSIVGNASTPANVVLSSTSANAIAVNRGALPGKLILNGLKLQTTTSGNCISATVPAVVEHSNMDFGSCAGIQINASFSAFISAQSNYTISGGAVRHWHGSTFGRIDCSSKTITLTGTPAFTAFAGVVLGYLAIGGNTFSGSATGARYDASLNGIIYTAGGGATYLPGNAVGSTGTGGQYV